MTDTEKAALERRIDELCAEVEAERQRNDKMFEAAVKWMAKAAHFEAENAKLREFAGQVLYFTTMTDGCGDNCPYSSSDCSHECHLREQGRELGIEVPS